MVEKRKPPSKTEAKPITWEDVKKLTGEVTLVVVGILIYAFNKQAREDYKSGTYMRRTHIGPSQQQMGVEIQEPAPAPVQPERPEQTLERLDVKPSQRPEASLESDAVSTVTRTADSVAAPSSPAEVIDEQVFRPAAGRQEPEKPDSEPGRGVLPEDPTESTGPWMGNQARHADDRVEEPVEVVEEPVEVMVETAVDERQREPGEQPPAPYVAEKLHVVEPDEPSSADMRAGDEALAQAGVTKDSNGTIIFDPDVGTGIENGGYNYAGPDGDKKDDEIVSYVRDRDGVYRDPHSEDGEVESDFDGYGE